MENKIQAILAGLNEEQGNLAIAQRLRSEENIVMDLLSLLREQVPARQGF